MVKKNSWHWLLASTLTWPWASPCIYFTHVHTNVITSITLWSHRHMCLYICENGLHKLITESPWPCLRKCKPSISHLPLVCSNWQMVTTLPLPLICMSPGFLSLNCHVRLKGSLIWVDRQQGHLLPCACIFQWRRKIGKQIYNNTWMHWIRKDSFGAMTSFYFPSDAHSTEICHDVSRSFTCFESLPIPLPCVCCCFFLLLPLVLCFPWIRNMLLRCLLWRGYKK